MILQDELSVRVAVASLDEDHVLTYRIETLDLEPFYFMGDCASRSGLITDPRNWLVYLRDGAGVFFLRPLYDVLNEAGPLHAVTLRCACGTPLWDHAPRKAHGT